MQIEQLFLLYYYKMIFKLKYFEMKGYSKVKNVYVTTIQEIADKPPANSR